MSIRHAKTSAKDDGVDTTLVRPSDWNADHEGTYEAFPVGSVFIAIVSTAPATLLGYGTWSAFGAGRVLVGLDSGDADFDVAEETGGAKTHTHASHTGTRKGGTTNPAEMATGELTHDSPKHLSPYIVVYMWKRTA